LLGTSRGGGLSISMHIVELCRPHLLVDFKQYHMRACEASDGQLESPSESA